MTREQAMKALKRLFGAKAIWRVGDSVSSPERRAKAESEAQVLKAQMEVIDAEIERRKREAGIPELVAQKNALYKDREKARGWGRYYKFSVGRNVGFANEIVAHGDTWQEAIDAAEAKRNGVTIGS